MPDHSLIEEYTESYESNLDKHLADAFEEEIDGTEEDAAENVLQKLESILEARIQDTNQ